MATLLCLVIFSRSLLMLYQQKHRLLLNVSTLLPPLPWALVHQDRVQVLWALDLVDWAPE
jgi:hypothetical protein